MPQAAVISRDRVKGMCSPRGPNPPVLQSFSPPFRRLHSAPACMYNLRRPRSVAQGTLQSQLRSLLYTTAVCRPYAYKSSDSPNTSKTSAKQGLSATVLDAPPYRLILLRLHFSYPLATHCPTRRLPLPCRAGVFDQELTLHLSARLHLQSVRPALVAA
jgi:hypothetical protein